MIASDVVLLPVAPSNFDLWATTETLAIVDEARSIRPDLMCRLILNRVIVGTAIAADIHKALGEMSEPSLETQIHQRVIFAEATTGQTVTEISPRSKAAQEIKKLTAEIRKIKA